MVDCPHLERAGYGGDGNSSTMSLQTMYDVAPTFENWVQTWGDSMREEEVCRMLVLIRGRWWRSVLVRILCTGSLENVCQL